MAPSQLPNLPNEIWIAIFKEVNFATLLDLSLVCKHWNRLIFTHLTNRIELSLDPVLLKYPPRKPGMVPGRFYKHLRFPSFSLDSPPAHLFKIVQSLAVHLESLTLILDLLECQKLAQLLACCTRMKKLCITARYFRCDNTKHNLEPAVLSSVRCLGFKVWQVDWTPHMSSMIARSMPNIQVLETEQYRSRLDPISVGLFAGLKVLKVTVHQASLNGFLSLRLSALEELNLTLLRNREEQQRRYKSFPIPAFQSFLLSCESLKTARFYFCFDQELLTSILTCLPRVVVLSLEEMGILDLEELSLNGMQRMTLLKSLSIKRCVLNQEDYPVVPTVEKLVLCFWSGKDDIGVITCFPNIKSLVLYGGFNQSIGGSVPLLEELTIFIDKISSKSIRHMQQLGLKRLTISSETVKTANFRLLRNLMVQPTMKYLEVETRSTISPTIASMVAGANESCQLILNGKLVKPAIQSRRRRSVRKPKRSTTVSTPQ